MKKAIIIDATDWQAFYLENFLNDKPELQFFGDPLLDIYFHIDESFNIDEELNDIAAVDYDEVDKNLIHKNFQQDKYAKKIKYGRLQITPLKEVKDKISNHKLYLDANKELGGIKSDRNYSKFAIRVIHSLAKQFPQHFVLLKEKKILVPIKSQTKFGDGKNRYYLMPQFVVNTPNIFSWKTVSIDDKASEGAYVALLSKIK